jgi:hypothetical protein
MGGWKEVRAGLYSRLVMQWRSRVVCCDQADTKGITEAPAEGANGTAVSKSHDDCGEGDVRIWDMGVDVGCWMWVAVVVVSL